MSAPTPAQRARELIDHQLTALGELRNANARDAGFKAWRQNTLTVIQRVWPDDPSRAERFRRVPFSAPSSKMNQVVMRSFFERGCAEAVKLLKAYLADAGSTTMVDGDAASDGNGFDPGTAEDDFPVVELTGRAVPADEASDPTRSEGVSIIDLGGESAPPPQVEEPPPGAGIPQLPRPVAPPPAPVAKQTPAAATDKAAPAPGKPAKPPAVPPPVTPPAKAATPPAAVPPPVIPPARAATPPAAARPPKHAPSSTAAPAAKAAAAPPPTVRPSKSASPTPPRTVTPAKAAASPPSAESRPPRAAQPHFQPRPGTDAPAAGAGGHDAHRALDAAIDAMGATPRPVTRPSRPGRQDHERDVAPEPARPAKPPRDVRSQPPERAELKNMLGFGDAPDEAPPAIDEVETTAAEAPEPEPEPPPAPVELESAETEIVEIDLDDDPFAPPDDEYRETAEPAPAHPSTSSWSPLGAVPEPAAAEPAWPPSHFDPPADESSAGGTGAPEAGEPNDAMREFMRSSPVLGASARPVRRPARPKSAMHSPAAMSLTALASEVAHLGVPEGQRAAARAQLLELARCFEEQTLSWESLRGAVTFVMEYPPLARRVIPMLIPYLDLAA